MKRRAICSTLAIAGLLQATALAASPARASDYLLGPQDRLRVKVYEWRPAQDKIVEWEGLNDEFIVGANGKVSLPLVGEIDAGGLTPSAVANAVGEALRSRMQLVQKPDTTVEVVQYRPFYITGDVMKPGEFPFRPGLTVIQALAIAGGEVRSIDFNARQREAIAARGELESLALSRTALLMRQARLKAEAANADSFAMPPELTREGSRARDAFEQETLIFTTRRDAFRTQMNALKSLKAFLDKEGESLGGQLDTEARQSALVQKELDGVASLVGKGLAAAPRQFALERTMAQLQGDRLRLETSILRAKQEASRAEISLVELQSKREGEIAVELRETDQRLRELANRRAINEDLLQEAMNAGASGARRDAMRQGLTFTVVRAAAPGEAITATESTPVGPGDMVKVTLPPPPPREAAAETIASGSPSAAPAKAANRAERGAVALN